MTRYARTQRGEETAPPRNADPDTLQRICMFWARHAVIIFVVCFTVSVGLGIWAVLGGGLSLREGDYEGWWSRGTTIAKESSQIELVRRFQESLFFDTSGSVWADLTQNVQRIRVEFFQRRRRRRMQKKDEVELWAKERRGGVTTPPELPSPSLWHGRHQPNGNRAVFPSLEEIDEKFLLMASSTSSSFNQFQLDENIEYLRDLQEFNSTNITNVCSPSIYFTDTLFTTLRLWPVWRTKNPATQSFLDPPLLEELCIQEQMTQQFLEENELCILCGDGSSCYQPFSLVLLARFSVPNGQILDCIDLSNAWALVKESVRTDLVKCVRELQDGYSPRLDGADLPDSCPLGFFPSMVDDQFHETGAALFTSSIFVTKNQFRQLYNAADRYARRGQNIDGAYGDNFSQFVNEAQDEQLTEDVRLAAWSALVTSMAMLIHTKSIFVTVIGLFQIFLAFPIAYLFYNVGFDTFPFINYLGIFVVFALGADDVFVAVDKWKNYRMGNKDDSTEEIAAKALPEAAEAMFLTTSTTAAAFFATAGSPIAPLKAFAVYVGLLVVCDYILCLLLVFPALCIYDRIVENDREGRKYYKWIFTVERQSELDADVRDESLIRRMLRAYHNRLHSIREVAIVLCITILLISCVQASRIERPSSSNVRVFDENDNQFEQRYRWNQNILFEDIQNQEEATVFVIWGVSAADTGDYKNPEEWSQLVLDDEFNPSLPEVQLYLRDFCMRLFAEQFATKVTDDYMCTMEHFDLWLIEQSGSISPMATYSDNCGGATGLPVDQRFFHSCLYAWSQLEGDDNVLARNQTIEIMIVPFRGRVESTSGFDDLEEEYEVIEEWIERERAMNAPVGAVNYFFGNIVFWWYDTNRVLLNTAVLACGIAMAATAGIVFVSSRSFVLTLFASLTVGYVTVSVAAILISLGWEIGFLESMLFSVLIGLSCDFVVHLCHAYTLLDGDVPSRERSLFALITMGPSILAAAFTTISGSFVMIFAVLTSFQRFGTILLFAMLQALLGAFVLFLTVVDMAGPSNPSQVVDEWLENLFQCCGLSCKRKNRVSYAESLEVVDGRNPDWPVVQAFEYS